MEHLTNFDLNVSFKALVIARCFQTTGVAFLFVPINTIAYLDLPKGKSNNASALVNLMRNLGSSVGVSVASTMITRRGQFHQVRLVHNISINNPQYTRSLHQVTNALVRQNVPPGLASRQAMSLMTQQLISQGTMLSYLDVFKIFEVLAFVSIALAFFLKTVKPGQKAGAHH
jgi:DHA2 family multidrug resistance protein